ncbi:hypothetical protein [Saccharothrix hoggarensis]
MVVRVRGVEDARRMREELRDERERPRGASAPAVAPPTGVGPAGVVAEGGDRIELDLDEFTRAETRLAELHATLARLLVRTADLEQPLGDGKGPVARHMRKAFGLRAGDLGGGVQSALQSYLVELQVMRDALEQVSDTQKSVDEQAEQDLRRL